MAEVARRPSQADSGSSSRSYSQSPQKKNVLHRSDSYSSSPNKSSNGHKKPSSLSSSPSKEERKKLAKEILASGGDQLKATLKQRGMLHALLSDPVRFIKSAVKQGQDYTKLGLTPVNDPNFAAVQKRKAEQKQHSLLLHTTDSPKLNGKAQDGDESISSPAKGKARSRDLYPYKISLRFPGKVRPSATGLSNYGNTCYMNSVMQSLIHTPPLAYALLTQDPDTLHGEWGGKPNANFDAVTAMQSFAKRSLQGTRPTNAPQEFNRNLKTFAKPLRQGRQEDAHEYLRFLLEALQQSCLARAPKSLKPDDAIRQTTFVHKTFGGKLRSRVTCHNCGHNSDTFDPFMDLSLDVRKGINSLTDAFRAFVAKDHLTGSEKYKCDKCKRKVDATKQFTIENAPPALTIHLKRFTVFGGKISRQIGFDENLNIAPYLSVNQGPARYKLYAAVHHYGSGPNSGHYVASVKSPCGKWTRMDDSHVSEMGRSGPTNDQSAYILFYLKEKDEALEKAIRAVAPEPPKSLSSKRKHLQDLEESENSDEAAETEDGADEVDDEAAYQALLKRRKAEKKAALPTTSPSSAKRKKSGGGLNTDTGADSDSSDSASAFASASASASASAFASASASASASAPKLNGTSQKLDAMLSYKPKSAASFYGNPFSMPASVSDDMEELGTAVSRDEYESLLGSASKTSVPSRSMDPEVDSDDEGADISISALSKKEKRKQKKAAQAIDAAKKARGVPASPYASTFTNAFAGDKEQKKKLKKKKEMKAAIGLGGLAGRMKPRRSM